MVDHRELYVNKESLLRGQELRLAQALVKNHTLPIARPEGRLCIYDITVLPGGDLDEAIKSREASSDFRRVKGVAIDLDQFRITGDPVCISAYSGIWMDIQQSMDILRERTF